MGAQKASVQRQVYGGAYITPAIWQHWEIRRYLLETETPGLFGYFGSCGAAK